MCIWARDADSDAWDSSCGHMFCLNEGTPLENDMSFCCFCGEPLVEELGETGEDEN